MSLSTFCPMCSNQRCRNKYHSFLTFVGLIGRHPSTNLFTIVEVRYLMTRDLIVRRKFVPSTHTRLYLSRRYDSYFFLFHILLYISPDGKHTNQIFCVYTCIHIYINTYGSYRDLHICSPIVVFNGDPSL